MSKSKKDIGIGECAHNCRVSCQPRRECKECPLDGLADTIALLRSETRGRCCGVCDASRAFRVIGEAVIGFNPCDPQRFCDSPELGNIRKVIRLGLDNYTCSARAASVFIGMHDDDEKPDLKQIGVPSFEEGVVKLTKSSDSALLIPHLNDLQKALRKNANFKELETQRFELPNPTLAVAHPISARTRRRILFAIPSLLPLVKKAYNGKIPFQEIVAMTSTSAAAEHCSRIFRGGYCVANEMQFDPFKLKPVKELPEKTVTWMLYANK